MNNLLSIHIYWHKKLDKEYIKNIQLYLIQQYKNEPFYIGLKMKARLGWYLNQEEIYRLLKDLYNEEGKDQRYLYYASMLFYLMDHDKESFKDHFNYLVKIPYSFSKILINLICRGSFYIRYFFSKSINTLLSNYDRCIYDDPIPDLVDVNLSGG